MTVSCVGLREARHAETDAGFVGASRALVDSAILRFHGIGQVCHVRMHSPVHEAPGGLSLWGYYSPGHKLHSDSLSSPFHSNSAGKGYR
jgi:hypothetical protein